MSHEKTTHSTIKMKSFPLRARYYLKSALRNSWIWNVWPWWECFFWIFKNSRNEYLAELRRNRPALAPADSGTAEFLKQFN